MSIIVKVRVKGPGDDVRAALRRVARASGGDREPNAVWMPLKWNDREPGEILDDVVEIEVFGVEKRVSAIQKVRSALEASSSIGGVVTGGGDGALISGGDLDLEPLTD